MKVLFLDTGFDNTGEFFRKEREKVSGVTNVCLYKRQKRTFFDKVIQAIGIYLFPPILYLIYGDWKKQIKEYDIFIVVSRKSAQYALKYIRKHTDKRVVVWYWNIVTYREMHPDYCKKIGCEPWSFDKEDCKKYGMKFGDTYYFSTIDKKGNNEILYDAFYVGINRPGRKELLDSLNDYFYRNGMTTKINLTAIPTDSEEIQNAFSPRMTYEEILLAIKQSRCIIDLNRENQTGMTLRPLEALYFKKKLITNNKSIVKYNAYCNENTYIIKDDQFDGLCDFIHKEYHAVDEKILEHYSFIDWLNRICSGVEAE